MPFALVCALVANVSYGLGTVLQAAGARKATTAAHLDVMLFARLSRQPAYLFGLGLDAVGFIASIIALRTLPLFAVQAAIAGSVGVTALAAVFVFGFHLRRSDVVAIAILVLGLVLLGVSAGGEQAGHLSHLGEWLLLVGVGVVALAGVAVARLPDPRGGIGLAVCAGFGFTGTAIAARARCISLILAGICSSNRSRSRSCSTAVAGCCCSPSALQRGSVTATTAVTFAVETIVPSIVGLMALGDRTRPHFQIVAIAGFGFTVGASLALARYSETVRAVEHAPEPTA